MSVQQGWSFMNRILQVQRKRMLYLSFPINTVGHYIRHASIKVFSEPNFLYVDRIQAHLRENKYLGKPVYSHILLSETL